jgi:hypothetical protein
MRLGGGPERPGGLGERRLACYGCAFATSSGFTLTLVRHLRASRLAAQWRGQHILGLPDGQREILDPVRHVHTPGVIAQVPLDFAEIRVGDSRTTAG